MSKKKKNAKKNKMRIIATVVISVVAILVVVLIMATLPGAKISLKDLKTNYKSLTLKVSYSTDCADESIWKIDYTTGDAFGEIKNATSDEYNCKRYFLGSRDQMYQKYYAADWELYDFNGEYPDSRIVKVLKYLSKSEGELLSEDENGLVFGVNKLHNPQETYEYLNDISALGNDWGAENYSSLSAKVYMSRNKNIQKVVFYPVSKSTDVTWNSYAVNTRLMLLPSRLVSEKNKSGANYDYIRSCKEITWTFSNINSTDLNYKEDLWKVLK